jgi:formylglycine-generating enzyme required for sulfatase activity
MRPLRVFLCHASQDKPAVRELYQKLRAETWIDPWLDEEKLLPGQDWHEEIEKAVEATDVVIVLLSKQSVSQEGYVQRELKLALDVADEKPENTIFIIPLRLDDCPAPRRLRGWHYVDYFPENRKSWAIERLLSSLKVRAETLGIKATVKEEPNKEIPTLETSEVPPSRAMSKTSEVKFTQKKPFTKLLEPSALSPKGTSKPTSDKKSNARRRKTEPDFVLELSRRLMSAGWIFLLVILVGGFGLNYYFGNPLFTTNTPSPTQTVTPKPPTFTSVPLTKTPTPTDTIIPTKTVIPTPTFGIMTGSDGMTLLYVPAGKFTMGSIATSDEQQIHKIYLEAFWIDETEVTNAMYAKCVNAKCALPSDTVYFDNPNYSDHPVVYVDWEMADVYCTWAKRRLPTEAEWEKAARGTDGLTYPWGETLECSRANFKSCIGQTSPVGIYGKGKSPYWAFDMGGNVREWVNDWYGKTYDFRVLRGGSWNDFNVSSTFRERDNPENSSDTTGFRCARSP